MTVAEGGGKRAVVRKFQDVYVPALRANYVLWPAVQILNFRVIPLQFQIVSGHCNLMYDLLLTTSPSRLCLLLVLPGQHICLLRTLQMKLQRSESELDSGTSCVQGR
jgi:hypothetical protein